VDGPAGEEGRKGGVLLLEAFDGEDVLGADAFHVLGAAVGLRRGEDDGGEGEEELINLFILYLVTFSCSHLRVSHAKRGHTQR